MNLSELEIDVRRTTEDLAPDIDARVTSFVQQAQEEAEDRHIFLTMETTLEQPTVTGTRLLVAKPDGWLRRLDVPVWVQGVTGTHVAFEWASSRGQLHQLYAATPDVAQYGAPKHLLELKSELWVYPLPDALNPVGTAWALGTYNVVVPYATRLTSLDAGGATNWLSEHGADYLISRASAEAFFVGRDFETSALWLGRAKSQLSKLIRLDKRQRFHLNQHMTPILQSARRVGRARPWM